MSEWFYCRASESCSAQCELCAEEQAQVRIRAEGHVPPPSFVCRCGKDVMRCNKCFHRLDA